MAIWDEKEEVLVVTESADSHKCLSCGGQLRFNTVEGMLQCVSCGNRFYPETFELNELLSERRELDIDSPEAKKRAEEDEYKVERKPKHEIICNSCGATVVTEVNTISTFCAFCGSSAIVKDRLKKEFRPDYIIPFKLTKEDAIKQVKGWAKTRSFLPNSFNSKKNLQKITGIYVPFWLIDADCHMDVGGVGTKSELGVDIIYDIRRKGMFKLKGVPFDGSKRISDTLMEAIEPFDYDELVPFTDAYLEGMYAERYDLTPKDMADRISNRFRDYMFDVGSSMLKLTSYSNKLIDDDRSVAKNYKCSYSLLPVWLLSYNYEGITYRVAVNGQTGEVEGRTPESRFKRALFNFPRYAWKLSFIYVILMVCVAAAYMYIFVGKEDGFNLVGLAIAEVVTFIATTICMIGTLAGKSSIFRHIPYLEDIAAWIDKIDSDNRIIADSKNQTAKMADISAYVDPSHKMVVEKIETKSVANIAMMEGIAMAAKVQEPNESFGFKRKKNIFDYLL